MSLLWTYEVHDWKVYITFIKNRDRSNLVVKLLAVSDICLEYRHEPRWLTYYKLLSYLQLALSYFVQSKEHGKVSKGKGNVMTKNE